MFGGNIIHCISLECALRRIESYLMPYCNNEKERVEEVKEGWKHGRFIVTPKNSLILFKMADCTIAELFIPVAFRCLNWKASTVRPQNICVSLHCVFPYFVIYWPWKVSQFSRVTFLIEVQLTKMEKTTRGVTDDGSCFEWLGDAWREDTKTKFCW